MEMTIEKNRWGNWEAKTTIELGDDRVLIFTTTKSSRKTLDTDAAVYRRDRGFLTHSYCIGRPSATDDYRKDLKKTTPARVGRKECETQHAEVVASRLEEIKAEALAHYEKMKPVAEVAQ